MNPHLIRPAMIPGLALAGLLLSVAAATPAHADDYMVPYCRTGGVDRPLQDWAAFNNRGNPADSATNGCADGSDVQTIDWVTNASRPAGSRTGWRLQARNGNRIVNWNASASATMPITHAAVDLTGIASCRAWEGCVEQSFGGNVAMNTDQIEFVMVCAANGSDTCNGGASARLWANEVTFRDPIKPSSSGIAGSLMGSSPGNPVSGTVDVTANAYDAGSGVRYFALAIDGKQVTKTLDQCETPYDRQVPCPVTASGNLRLDTTTVPDGTHTVQVYAVDASGGTGILWDGQLIVGNSPTRGPGGDPNVRGAQNGSHGGDDAAITAWWPATGRKPSSKKSVQRRCKKSKAYRRRHAVLCNGRAPSQKLRTSFSTKRGNILRGRIANGAGQPIVGASVQIVAAPTATGLAPSVVATPVTDTDGRFVATLPVSSGSARFQINWMARARDTQPAASTAVRRTVRSSTTFAVSPRRVVRRGRILTFHGTLRGTTGARQGNAVSIEANPGSSWRAVRTVRANSNGRWRVRYRVPRQLRGSYRFRAVVSPSAAYPYGTGVSSTRRVRVR